MGGYGSGRIRTRNRAAVEQSLRVRISEFRRQGFIQPGARTAGIWSWGGVSSGAIGFAIDLANLDDAYAELGFTCGGAHYHQRIEIEATRCRFGGRRFYFICPWTGRRCEILCCVDGVFASREFHRLAYACQSEDRLNRLYRGRAKAEMRVLSGEGKPRPRGPNRERKYARLRAYEDAADALFASQYGQRFGQFGPNADPTMRGRSTCLLQFTPDLAKRARRS